MQEYDVALKLLLQGSASLTAAAKWLDVELPKVQNLQLDLLGETVDGGLVHWSCKAATMRRCRCGWPNTAWVSFACSDDSRARSCCTWANPNCAWRTNCAASTCCSGTALSQCRRPSSRIWRSACWTLRAWKNC